MRIFSSDKFVLLGGSQNNSDRYLEGNRADFKSCGLLEKSNDGPVSSWQGENLVDEEF